MPVSGKLPISKSFEGVTAASADALLNTFIAATDNIYILGYSSYYDSLTPVHGRCILYTQLPNEVYSDITLS